MDFDLIRAVRDLALPPPPPVLTMADKLVLALLAMRANHTGFCWTSYTTIARNGWMGVRTAKTSIARLVSAGMVEVCVRREDGSYERAANGYRVLVRPATEVVPQLHEVVQPQHDLVQQPHEGGADTARGVVPLPHGGGAVTAHRSIPRSTPTRSSTEKTSFALARDDEAPASKKAKKEATPEHRAVVAHFVALFEQARKCKPEITAKDHIAVNRLLGNGRTVDEAKAILDRAFAVDFVRESKPDLAYIASSINAYLGSAPTKTKGQPPVQPTEAERGFQVGRRSHG